MVRHRTPSPMLSPHDVATILSVHINTVRRWGDSGVMKVYRIGPRRDRRFRLEDIAFFLTEQSDKPKDLIISSHQSTLTNQTSKDEGKNEKHSAAGAGADQHGLPNTGGIKRPERQ